MKFGMKYDEVLEKAVQLAEEEYAQTQRE